MPDQSKTQATDNIAILKAGERKEPVASFLKIKLVELSPGYAKVTMKLLPEYQNFNGLIFGGIIMALTDQAFAYASNSLAYPSLAAQFNIHFINGAAINDELTAECRVVKSGRRAGISEMTVTNQDGKLIARATGTTIPVEQKTTGQRGQIT
ncbi:MAG: PaaI family thioesterase [Chloroflexota bacterium]